MFTIATNLCKKETASDGNSKKNKAICVRPGDYSLLFAAFAQCGIRLSQTFLLLFHKSPFLHTLLALR